MRIIFLLTFLIIGLTGFNQKQTFDIISFTAPKGWVKQTGKDAIQFSREDKTSGAYALFMLFKSMPGSADAKTNFVAAWETIVKETVSVSGAPEMQEPLYENGWESLSGIAPFENEGQKGVALLVTASSGSKMVNILLLTNTDAYQKEADAFIESITLKKIVASVNKNKPVEKKVSENNTIVKNGGYTFNTTNFDDGWVSIIKEDWVEVSKPGIKILIHYPNKKADIHNFNKLDGDNNAWNILVAPRYTNITNFYERGIQDYQSITFLTADATEKSTNKKVHVILFKKHYDKGNGRYMEVVADSKARFEQEFGNNYINRSSWDYIEQTKSWDKLANMQWRNKFSVAANDLLGTWSSSTYESLAYYYVNSGGFAGATATSIADEFTFMPGNKYQSDHSGASGVVGNQKFSRQVYKGNSIVTNWTISLSNRFQGATEKYDCYFEAIKGGRILMMTDRLGYSLSLVKSK